MNEKIIPAVMISVLAITIPVILLLALKKILPKTGWEQRKQNSIFFFTAASIGTWLVSLCLLSLNGFFSHFETMPPRPVLAILAPLPLVLLVVFSGRFTQLIKLVPAAWLVLLQTFRIAVEVILFAGYLNKLLPEQMTFGGNNFDIITGLIALPVGYYCFIKKSWPRWIAVMFNIGGLLLLLNVLIIALLSMPTPFRYFMNEPSMSIVGTFPFIFLPGVLVVIAYSLHIFSLRQLWLTKNKV